MNLILYDLKWRIVSGHNIPSQEQLCPTQPDIYFIENPECCQCDDICRMSETDYPTPSPNYKPPHYYPEPTRNTKYAQDKPNNDHYESSTTQTSNNNDNRRVLRYTEIIHQKTKYNSGYDSISSSDSSDDYYDSNEISNRVKILKNITHISHFFEPC